MGPIGPRIHTDRPYGERVTVPARDIAAVLRQWLPDIGTKKLHKLLYYIQGHHLATFREPLFDEDIVAYDMGPVVEKLWQEEAHGLTPAPHEPARRPLSEAELNTIGYVISRYGSMTGSDLQRLSHQERPWQQADVVRRRSGRKSATIERAWLIDYFSGQQASDDDLELPADAFDRLGRDVALPYARPRRPDTREALHAQLRGYAGDRAR